MKLLLGVIFLVGTSLTYPLEKDDVSPAVPLVIADYSSVAKSDDQSAAVQEQKVQIREEVLNDSSESNESNSSESSESKEEAEAQPKPPAEKPVEQVASQATPAEENNTDAKQDELAGEESKPEIPIIADKPKEIILENPSILEEPKPLESKPAEPNPTLPEEEEPKRVDDAVALPVESYPEKPSDLQSITTQVSIVKALPDEKIDIIEAAKVPAAIVAESVFLPEKKAKEITPEEQAKPTQPEGKPAEQPQEENKRSDEPAQLAVQQVLAEPSEQKIETANVAEEIVPEAQPAEVNPAESAPVQNEPILQAEEEVKIVEERVQTVAEQKPVQNEENKPESQEKKAKSDEKTQAETPQALAETPVEPAPEQPQQQAEQQPEPKPHVLTEVQQPQPIKPEEPKPEEKLLEHTEQVPEKTETLTEQLLEASS